MAGNIDEDTYTRIYRMLDDVSPVPFDCGSICGKACCISENEGDGIFLLPGEEKLHRKEDWKSWEVVDPVHFFVPEVWDKKAVFVTCGMNGLCKRQMRPIQCRTFPLAINIIDGKAVVEKNGMSLGYCCPLVEQEAGLDPKFVETTRRVWDILIKDELICEWVRFLYEKMNGEM